MSSHKYTLNVQMGCGGCSSAIKEAMEALNGVQSHSISLEEQTVSVMAEPSLSYETVLEAIKAKGKNVRSGEADGVAQPV
ncbi:Heavy metal-associated domain HMA [Penicillium concentricum]|uniref:Heavy metal-associated domain HMA n=1 Tax=Penicillium concentricum TaxID=293559 RepID=A0A9W9RHK6_9EURO|nr:Heavy metal-associated domain HMA [Penicillium concentricum]KAJ5360261.1 Heavy metal-associated domain HMA [Penicillium concentricum]